MFTSTQDSSWELGDSSVWYTVSLLDGAQGAKPKHIILFAHFPSIMTPSVVCQVHAQCIEVPHSTSLVSKKRS